MRTTNFSIKNLTKGKLPSLPFLKIKNAILGKKYNLSLVFTNVALIQKLNQLHRKKKQPTDILSFSLSKSEGEIFVCLKIAKAEAIKFERKFDNFIAFLLIHGLHHLKGFEHGSRMEVQEIKFRNKFGI